MNDTTLSSPLPSVGLEALEGMADRAAAVVERLRARVFTPDSLKTLDLRFNVKSAAAMVGRSEKLIRDAEADGRLPPAILNPETGRRTGYTLKGVNRMRDVFNTRPWRAETDEPIVIAVQNFKGGVGKTTLACATAVGLADQGKRVLLVSTDPASNLGHVFGVEINEHMTPVPQVPNLTAMNIDPQAAAAGSVGEVAAHQPYSDLESLCQISDAVIKALPWPEVLAAVSAHPRIGERAGGESREARWSRSEQATAATDLRRTSRLQEANAEYERRFGHVFLINAAGRSAEEMLAALRRRMVREGWSEAEEGTLVPPGWVKRTE